MTLDELKTLTPGDAVEIYDCDYRRYYPFIYMGRGDFDIAHIFAEEPRPSVPNARRTIGVRANGKTVEYHGEYDVMHAHVWLGTDDRYPLERFRRSASQNRNPA